MNALQTLLNTTDPQANEPYTPLTPADDCVVTPFDDTGCWQTWTGTHYPTRASVPWQCGSTLVACDGSGPAHS